MSKTRESFGSIKEPNELARLIADCDVLTPIARANAFDRLSAYLAGKGLRYGDIARALASASDSANVANREDQPQPAEQIDVLEPIGPVFHYPLAGRWRRSHAGKRVMRRIAPPPGVSGRLRITGMGELPNGVVHDMVALICSFETESEIYEPFRVVEPIGSPRLEQLVRASRSGRRLRLA